MLFALLVEVDRAVARLMVGLPMVHERGLETKAKGTT